MAGKANLEVRPTHINKGEIARRIVEEHCETDTPPEFILCMGDDFTDEDMFRALNNAVSSSSSSHTNTSNNNRNRGGLQKEQVFTVTVGASSKMTLAGWHLLEPADVIATLGLLNSNGGGDVDAINGDGRPRVDGHDGMPSAKDVIQGVLPDALGNTDPPAAAASSS